MLAKVFRTEYISRSEDNYDEILKGVTSWEEITEEDADRLTQGGYIVIRQLRLEEITTTVAKLKKDLETIKKQQLATEKKWKEEETARKAKALQRKLDKAKKLLEQHQ